MKQGIELWHDVLRITCSMFFTIRYNIKCGLIEGHAMLTLFYCVLVQYVHAMASLCILTHTSIVCSSAAMHCCIVTMYHEFETWKECNLSFVF